MPTPPEIGDGDGFEWLIEIDADVETKDGGYADGDVGVAREIEVNLHSETKDAHEVFETGKTAIYGENNVNIHTKIIGNDGFFDDSF